MNRLVNIYSRLSKYPMGKSLFSWAACKKAPYFSTIKPMITRFEPGFVEVQMKQRRSVQNHIQTIHAIAVCNLCELAMGLAVEATISPKLRWLPKGINAEYLKKASGYLIAACSIQEGELRQGDCVCHVEVRNLEQELVVKCSIPLHITEKRS